ncbi:MAG: biotin--[acetyl-CoA-carboxylase] ligase [Alphaproteobacteria bacterium]|nr:biotin--[acetyl-CoA-carboxylase] ligase [Alphaproteobacteria bacterium]
MTAWPQGSRLLRLDEIDSTNSEARRRAEAGERGPLWIMAARQSAGRGRRGAIWQGAEGNLMATLLLSPPGNFAQLSFAAALAVADMVQHFAPAARITLKWPNDVLADNRKLAGILLESGSGWLAIGIGINLAAHPEGTEFPATSLAALGVVPPKLEEALTLLAARFAHWYDRWMSEGFEALRTAWLARAPQLGAPIRARLPHETRHGLFAGIDAGGALLLREPAGVRAIAAGEVFF